MSEFLTLKEAATVSGLSLSTLRRAVKAGELVTVPRVNTQHPVKVPREAIEAFSRRSVTSPQDAAQPAQKDELTQLEELVSEYRATIEGLTAQASRDALEIVSLGDEVASRDEELEELRAEREELIRRAERAEGVAEGYRLGVDRTLEAFTDDLSKRLAEGVQVVQPLSNLDQVVTFSPAEPVSNSEQVRRLTLKERLSGRLRSI